MKIMAPPVLRMASLLIPLLWVVMASAMLLESDAYRYATILLACSSLIWFREHLKLVARDWLAILCWAWAGYALLRFAVGVFVYDEAGSSEWLYIFPLFFPGLGVALYCTRKHLFEAASILVCLGFVGLLVTLDWSALGTGERVFPLFHNNPIHAGIGCGMLLITTIFWMLYTKESGRLSGWWEGTAMVVGSATILLSLVGLLGAQSKGAWLAFLLTAVLTIGLTMLLYGGRLRWVVVAVCIVVAGLAVTTARDSILHVAAPTIESTAELAERGLAHVDVLEAMRQTVEDPNTPASMRERLMLWTNALDAVRSSPWVGWGNLWQREWRQGTYSDTSHRLLHNGYLEILVRHGALGALMLTLFAAVAAQRLHRAWRQGVISSSLMLYLYSLSFFFFITIASNSNNRLALGESYFLLTAAAVFAISLAMRERSLCQIEKRIG